MRSLAAVLPLALAACAHGKIAPSDIPPADAYAPIAATPHTPLSEYVQKLNGEEVLVHDERLDRAAHLLAEGAAAGADDLSAAYVAELLWRLGVVGYGQTIGAWATGKRDREASLNTWLADNFVKKRERDNVAFGVALGGGGSHPTFVRVVMVRKDLIFDPLPRSYAPNATITLAGTVLQKDAAKLTTFGPGAAVPEEVAVVDGHFSVIWKAPETPGLYEAEVMLGGLDGTPVERHRTLLLLRFVVGPVEETFDDTALLERPGSLEAAAADRLNALRARRGLAPLRVEPDETVTAAANSSADNPKTPLPAGMPAVSLKSSLEYVTSGTALLEHLSRPSQHARFLAPQLQVLHVAAAKNGQRTVLVLGAK